MACFLEFPLFSLCRHKEITGINNENNDEGNENQRESLEYESEECRNGVCPALQWVGVNGLSKNHARREEKEYKKYDGVEEGLFD